MFPSLPTKCPEKVRIHVEARNTSYYKDDTQDVKVEMQYFNLF